MKFIVCLLGLILVFPARAEVDTAWMIGKWKVNSELTISSARPNASPKSDGIVRIKAYLDQLTFRITEETMETYCPAYKEFPEIHDVVNYTITGTVAEKIVVKVWAPGTTKIGRAVLSFESKDRFSALLKVISGRGFYERVKE